MYRLAYLSTPPRVESVPHFPHLKETNVRQGFVTPEQFAKLVAHCPDLWFRAMLETAHNYGWRVSELLNLRVGQVDLVGRTIRLDPGTTKNHEGREVTIESGRLLELLRLCVTGKRPEDHVFTRGNKPIRGWRVLGRVAGAGALVAGVSVVASSTIGFACCLAAWRILKPIKQEMRDACAYRSTGAADEPRYSSDDGAF
jgi:integrase